MHMQGIAGEVQAEEDHRTYEGNTAVSILLHLKPLSSTFAVLQEVDIVCKALTTVFSRTHDAFIIDQIHKGKPELNSSFVQTLGGACNSVRSLASLALS